ncbi:hypothetical protein [Candidatus Mycolicibacterium alkanivorans]|uniref:DUF732 domain-containing protein n=1 Tax=Candidatus Mycolicibacterium alkanivorans TaxID=2954114 RepID=A0ABS9YSS2_9MYCO|nr:hypothetical protein [Candidatus Mycolicibacterium alkanivorans]MCI4673434.1 hypothetical protein [Candidatus Mycolicibacterium alkanivorans]
MRQSVIGVGVGVAGVLVAGVFGTGAAAASPPYYGMTYAKAVGIMQSKGQTPAIATVIGSQLPTDDCVVTNAYKSFTLDSSGRTAHRGTWMLDLNCNRAVAQAGKPGNSVMTPEGQKAKAIDIKSTSISDDFAKATKNGKAPWCEANARRCQQICDSSGMCSDDLVKYLASL